jgi:nicotinamide mononucleotide adenylyltransferase
MSTGNFTNSSLDTIREMLSGTLDYTRCVRPNGTAYGTGGKCRKGTEKQKDYPYEAAVTQGRFNIPHSGHAKLIKGMLEKAPVVHVVLGKGKENVDKDFRAQMLRAVLRKEGVDLNRVKLVQGSSAASVLKSLAEKSGKEKVLFMLGEDQQKFLETIGKSLGVKTDTIPRDSSGSSSSAIRRMIDSGDTESLRKEFGDNPYLQRLAKVARKVERNEFSEEVK